MSHETEGCGVGGGGDIHSLWGQTSSEDHVTQADFKSKAWTAKSPAWEEGAGVAEEGLAGTQLRDGDE